MPNKSMFAIPSSPYTYLNFMSQNGDHQDITPALKLVFYINTDYLPSYGFQSSIKPIQAIFVASNMKHFH